MNIFNINNLFHTEMIKAKNVINTQKTVETASKFSKKNPRLYKACQDFEAIFIKQMLNVMRKTVSKSGLLSGGFAEEVFEDLLYDEYAKKMVKNAHFGLSDTLYKQLKGDK